MNTYTIHASVTMMVDAESHQDAEDACIAALEGVATDHSIDSVIA